MFGTAFPAAQLVAGEAYGEVGFVGFVGQQVARAVGFWGVRPRDGGLRCASPARPVAVCWLPCSAWWLCLASARWPLPVSCRLRSAGCCLGAAVRRCLGEVPTAMNNANLSVVRGKRPTAAHDWVGFVGNQGSSQGIPGVPLNRLWWLFLVLCLSVFLGALVPVFFFVCFSLCSRCWFPYYRSADDLVQRIFLFFGRALPAHRMTTATTTERITTQHGTRLLHPLSACRARAMQLYLVTVSRMGGHIRVYDARKSAWLNLKAPHPVSPQDSSQATLFCSLLTVWRGRLVVLARLGREGGAFLQMLNPASWAWQAITEPEDPMPPSAVVAGGGRLIVFHHQEHPNPSEMVEYGMEGGWRRLPCMAVCRWQFSVCAMSDRLVVVGGRDPQTGRSLRTVEQFLHAEQKWEPLPDMLHDRLLPGVAVWQGRLVVLGGCRTGAEGGPARLGFAEAYDPVVQQWMPLPCLSRARDFPTACVYQGNLLVVGGMGEDLQVPLPASVLPPVPSSPPPLPVPRHFEPDQERTAQGPAFRRLCPNEPRVFQTHLLRPVL